MSLENLDGFFNEEEIKSEFNEQQVNALYEKFKEDFVDNPFTVRGKTVKIISQHSKISQYSTFCESFVHIITRRYKGAGGRIYDASRANKIHWIKEILINSSSKEIFYYKWMDDDGICKEHFWYFKKDFMVVLKDIAQNVQIVTSFCVDSDDKLMFYERYSDFKEGNGSC